MTGCTRMNGGQPASVGFLCASDPARRVMFWVFFGGGRVRTSVRVAAAYPDEDRLDGGARRLVHVQRAPHAAALLGGALHGGGGRDAVEREVVPLLARGDEGLEQREGGGRGDVERGDRRRGRGRGRGRRGGCVPAVAAAPPPVQGGGVEVQQDGACSRTAWSAATPAGEPNGDAQSLPPLKLIEMCSSLARRA